jgi:hypothetical protein
MNSVLNNEIRSVAVKLVDQLKARDPITKSGLEFFAGRSGQTIEQYAMDAILQRLECDEVRYARRLQPLRQDAK